MSQGVIMCIEKLFTQAASSVCIVQQSSAIPKIISRSDKGNWRACKVHFHFDMDMGLFERKIHRNALLSAVLFPKGNIPSIATVILTPVCNTGKLRIIVDLLSGSVWTIPDSSDSLTF